MSKWSNPQKLDKKLLGFTSNRHTVFFVSCENFPSNPRQKPFIVYLCGIVNSKYTYEDISGKHVPSEDERSGSRQPGNGRCAGIVL